MSEVLSYKAWFKMGIDQGFLGHKYCTTHFLTADCTQIPENEEIELIRTKVDNNECVTFIYLKGENLIYEGNTND